MTATTLIKLYGERNTGTNYVRRLLELNFSAPVQPGVVGRRLGRPIERLGAAVGLVSPRLGFNIDTYLRDCYFLFQTGRTLGWKHGTVPLEHVAGRPEAGLVCLVKHPYAWALSMFDSPHHTLARAETLEAFLQTPYDISRRDRIELADRRPLRFWTAKTRSYFAAQERFPDRTVIVRYEDLILDEANVIARIAETLGLPRPGAVRSVTQATKTRDKSREDYVEYYSQEKWRERLGPALYAAMNAQLDHDIVEACGYQLTGPTEA